MSQPNSSMISNGIPNAQIKYQKALKQISKLIQTNKILKNQCQQRQKKMGSDLSQIAIRYDQLTKKYEQLLQQKISMQQYIQQQQDTHQDLKKQNQTKQRQIKYLNDVLNQKNTQLKKLQAFKDQKGITQLFKSYQDKQIKYKKDIIRLQQHINNLQRTIDTLQEDLIQERQTKQRYQDQYNILDLQITKFKDLNNYLINQNQSIINGTNNKNNNNNKSKQLQNFVVQFKNQLQNLRNIQFQNQNVSQKQYKKNYEILLQEKNLLTIQLIKIKDQLQISQIKINQMYEMQQKMSNALLKADILIEQNNMLKNRITILQSKDIIDALGLDQDNQFKDYQDKINLLLNKSDPLESIKNGQDNSHFIMMKSFIIELQKKIDKLIQQKNYYQKKYNKIKNKFNKIAQENIIFEENNKLMKGKLEGYQRLTEKLHYQLERSMHAHQNEIVKMVAITNNLVGKKVQQSKSASAFIKNQFDIQIEKAQRTQKSLSQQLQTLKLQGSTQRIKIIDLQERLRQITQLMEVYQRKLNQNTQRYKQLQQQNTRLNQNLVKFEQLYHDQKVRHQTILIQKQNLSNKANILSEQIMQKTYKYEQVIREKGQFYSNQIRKIKSDNMRLKDQLQLIKQQNKRMITQLQDRRIRQANSYSNFKQQNNYYSQLENSYKDLKNINKILQEQLISIKNKTNNIDQLKSNLVHIQNQLMKKTDQLNDQKRIQINLKRDIQNLQLTNNDLTQHNRQLLQEIQLLRSKLYKDTNNLKTRDSLNSNKQFQLRKTIQRLNQEISVFQAAMRDQKRNFLALSAEIQNYKTTIQGLNEMLARSKAKQLTLNNKISQFQDQTIKLKDELQNFKLKASQSMNSLSIFNNQITELTKKTTQLTDQLNMTKNKSTQNERRYQSLMRQVSGLKYNIVQAQKMVKRLNNSQKLDWDQQREKQNLSTLVVQFNKILKNAQNQLSNSSSTGQYKFLPASSFGNIDGKIDYTYLNNNSKYSFNTQENRKLNINTNQTIKYQTYSLGNYDFSDNSYINSSVNNFQALTRQTPILNI